ncbi:serine hydrolase domain-containing protein [Aerolutibacter ruishenii]|uniref:CubicO group peptidase (Beta-lactamase class C family) n=1 Tax=Aerolutibacter ruishenii TaxID=686800 RepID=A0A562LYT7_9GAMM|nr:serine hydrolase domain-containing protein [Lysobacter ruishenii]TWI12770.1 CubicO group peptidase (beta-lactamase class C family) [Lysobacter ruishenii]
MRLSALFLPLVIMPLGDAVASNATQEVDVRLERYTGDVPGAVLLVLHDGTPVIRRAVGLADVDAGIPVTLSTNFRLASVSKQFTAAAVLLLAEDGRLHLDDPVSHWLPQLPANANDVTLHHLLSHTSGLHDYEDLMAADFKGQVHDADIPCLLASGRPCGADAGTIEPVPGLGPPYFPAGTAYRYSNTGYALLSLVVERASGQPYPEFLRQRIFAPLGMDGTVAFVDGASTVPARAYGHSLDRRGWNRTDQSTTSAVLGDGGIYSSIDDLAKWDAALRDDRLLSARSRGLAFSPQTTTATGEADVDAYGYGWRLYNGMHWHSGETIGFRNVILRWPAQRLTVILLSNRDDPEPYVAARAIGEAFLRDMQGVAPGTTGLPR